MDTQAIRKKILDLALRGKLTEQLPEDGTGQQLFQHIQERKAVLAGTGKAKKQESLIPLTKEDIPFEIPDNWQWVRLGDITAKITSGSTPTGGKKSDAYVDKGFCFFREQNIYNDGIHSEGMVYITEQLLNTRENSTVIAKDILLNITGGSIGRCAIVPDDFSKGSINQHILIIRMVEEETRFFTHLVLCSPYAQNHIKSKAVGDKDGFSGGRCKYMPVPLPPLSVQKRIVSIIHSAFSVLDTIDTLQGQYQDNLATLKSKIIDAGIQGKLTEQLPEDGTAEELYQRIQQEKLALEKASKIKKSKPLPPISEEEKPFDIPDNWNWVRLADVYEINPKVNADDNINAAFIPMERISAGFDRSFSYVVQKWSEASKNHTRFCDGDVAFAKISPCFENRKSFVVENLPNSLGGGTTELIILRQKLIGNQSDRK